MTLSIDGSNKGNFTSGTSSQTVSLSTTNANDIIVVLVGYEINASSGAPTVSSVSDTAGLTWHRRGGAHATTNNKDCVLDCWWAYSSGTLSSDTITVTLSGNVDNGAVVACGVSGVPSANYSAPWDTNAALPVTGTGTVSGINQVTIAGVSTTSTSGLMIANAGAASSVGALFNTAPTGVSPWSLIQFYKETGGINYWSGAEAYDTYTSALSSASETCITGFSANAPIIYYLDALSGSASGSAFTLDTAVGSFVLSGLAATWQHGMNAAVGAFTVVGQAAAAFYKLGAAVGSYVLTGIAAALGTIYLLAAAVGSYALTGIAAAFHVALSLKAAAGSYALSGLAVALSRFRQFLLVVGTGAYQTVGYAARLKRRLFPILYKAHSSLFSLAKIRTMAASLYKARNTPPSLED